MIATKMDEFTKALYRFLCFSDKPNTSDAKNMKEFAKRLNAIFVHSDAYEFMELCGRPSNHLYGEFMKKKTSRVKGKTNSSFLGI